MLILSDGDIRAVLTPAAVIASQAAAYRLAADGTGPGGGHFHFTGPTEKDLVFAHGAVIPAGGAVFKTGVQVPANTGRGVATVQATVTVHDRTTGVPVALLNGATVTTLRTAGGLVAAAAALIGSGPVRLGIFGTGAQAGELARLAAAVLPLDATAVWSPSEAGRRRVATDSGWQRSGVTVASGPDQLTRDSTLIATCTSSAEPVLQGRWLGAGTTVLTMGSYAPDRREIDLPASMRADLTFVDGPGAERSVGPLVAAAESVRASPGAVGLVGTVIDGGPGRTADDQIVVFHSSGLGVQDAALALSAYTSAAAAGVGTHVEL
ncbi:ornithine cyclodeaminase family protein [Nakamurella deserti]|uniref:ornithine cyclodeaminase family protein n=1 Tax=Nakamurella deserti TaxID=2164074 RepID=UPI000DBE483A|nr:ornithine cyclodeaminase family protein [Nakamurella deserti]